MAMHSDDIASHRALARHADALKALGYRTVEEVASAIQAAGDAMAAYLGEDLRSAFPPPSGRPSGAARQFPLGVALDRLPPPRTAFGVRRPPPSGVPASTNLIGNMSPILNQVNRGTCVAFASLALVQHLRGTQGLSLDLSEQYLYWKCKQTDGYPNEEGTYIFQAMTNLQTDGCCLETTWPYNGTPIPGNESQGPPPPISPLEIAANRIRNFNQLPPTSVDYIKWELSRGRAVAFAIPVFNSWYGSAAVRDTGYITMPIPFETPGLMGHAMCICGHQDNILEAAVGGGHFIIRNSWGTGWASTSPYGPGYGSIPYNYIAYYGREAFSIE